LHFDREAREGEGKERRFFDVGGLFASPGVQRHESSCLCRKTFVPLAVPEKPSAPVADEQDARRGRGGRRRGGERLRLALEEAGRRQVVAERRIAGFAATQPPQRTGR